MGYRLFDCAPVYFNEKELGDAFHESTSGVPRTDVFITSKLASPFHRPEHVEPALRKTLNGEFIGSCDGSGVVHLFQALIDCNHNKTCVLDILTCS